MLFQLRYTCESEPTSNEARYLVDLAHRCNVRLQASNGFEFRVASWNPFRLRRFDKELA